MRTLWSILFAIALVIMRAPLNAQSRVANQSSTWHQKDREWASYSADVRGSRYRPLDQINASNFNQLEVAWRFKTDHLGPFPEFKLEGTPLMVSGVIYTTGGTRRAVVALDASVFPAILTES